MNVQYTVRQPRRATKDLECTGGSAWCPGVIHTGETYTVLLNGRECVGKWCPECSRVLS